MSKATNYPKKIFQCPCLPIRCIISHYSLFADHMTLHHDFYSIELNPKEISIPFVNINNVFVCCLWKFSSKQHLKCGNTSLWKTKVFHELKMLSTMTWWLIMTLHMLVVCPTKHNNGQVACSLRQGCLPWPSACWSVESHCGWGHFLALSYANFIIESTFCHNIKSCKRVEDHLNGLGLVLEQIHYSKGKTITFIPSTF